MHYMIHKKLYLILNIFLEFFEWFEYDERDKYREMFEQRYTKDSYYTYIEAYDENHNLLSKTRNDMIINKYSEAAAVKARWLGNFCPRQPDHRAPKHQPTSRDRRLRSGRPGWMPQALQTRRVGTVFLSVCSITALCALE